MSADVQAHFGLTHLPFTREVRIIHQWQHSQFLEVKQELKDVVEERMSGALIAPAGSGKTQVLRSLVADLPSARYAVTAVKVTGLSMRDFCRHIATAVGAKAAGHTGALVNSLQERFTNLVQMESQRPVLVLDEAHDLRPEVLQLLRLVTNFELDSRLVVSVLLCGQPPLRQLLASAAQEAVSRRIAYFGQLRTLDRSETRSYVEHRVHTAGATSELWSSSGYDALFECSQGNLRATDRIALASLKAAVRRKVYVVDAELVGQARATVWP